MVSAGAFRKRLPLCERMAGPRWGAPNLKSRTYFSGSNRVENVAVNPKPHLLIFGSMHTNTRILEKYADVYSGLVDGVSVIPLTSGDLMSRTYRERLYAKVERSVRASPGNVHVHVLSAGCLHFFFFSERYPVIAKRIASVVMDSPSSLFGLEGFLRAVVPEYAKPMVRGASELLLSLDLPAMLDAKHADRCFQEGPPPSLTPRTPCLLIHGGKDDISPAGAIHRVIAAWKCESLRFEECAHLRALQAFPRDYRTVCRQFVKGNTQA